MTSSRPLVDPELHALLEGLPQTVLDETTLALFRDPSRMPYPPVINPDRVEKRFASARGLDGAPDVPLTCYRPAGRAGAVLPCIYYIHGGGYVCGAAAALESVHRLMVEELDCALIAVDYRLAPETPFPGPLEDCYAGLAWLWAKAGDLGVDAGRIGVMGESAGGGLAAALALLARDRGEMRLAFQQLIYPMLDDRTCADPDPNPYAGEFVWTPAHNAFGWRSYLGAQPGSGGVSSYAAAARAEDLGGLPPAFISSGALDLFIDEDIAYATRLIRAGVPTELHVYPGGFHGFGVVPSSDVGHRMRRDSWHALRRRLHPPEG